MTASNPLVWLITGCSSGFGEQFVHQIIARGDRVIATGRNSDTKLAHLSSTGAAILDLDVSSGVSKITETVNRAISIYGHIDVLVNNAGYIESASMEELGDERLRKGLETNFFGPANVARALIPHMRERKTGTIAWVGSLAGVQGFPSASAYVSAKFALEGLVDCLVGELAMFGLKTIIFEPGYFRTKALKQGNLIHEPTTISAYEQFNKSVLEFETATHGNEPGDPVKGVATMIQVITSSGVAEGKQLPLRLPIGSDGLKVFRDRCEAGIKLVDEWESVIRSADDPPK